LEEATRFDAREVQEQGGPGAASQVKFKGSLCETPEIRPFHPDTLPLSFDPGGYEGHQGARE
jgi:hypothetical protein